MAGLQTIRRRIRNAPRKLEYDWGPALGSTLRKRWAIAANPHATIEFHEPVFIGPGFRLNIHHAGTFICEPGVVLRRNFHAEIMGDGVIRIGANTVFTHDAVLQCTTEIAIGENCGLGQCTAIFDGTHHFRDPDIHMFDQGYDFRPIRIDDEAMIMSKVTIVNSIGEKAVVGANSVVNKPIPAYTFSAGAPARPIDYFGPPGGEPAELLAQGERT